MTAQRRTKKPSPPTDVRGEIRQTFKHAAGLWGGLALPLILIGSANFNAQPMIMLAIGWIRAPLDGFGIEPVPLLATLTVLGLITAVGQTLLARRRASRPLRVAVGLLPPTLLAAGLAVSGVALFDGPDGDSEFVPALPDVAMLDPCHLLVGTDSLPIAEGHAALHRRDSNYNYYATDVIDVGLIATSTTGPTVALVAVPRDPEALARFGFTSCFFGTPQSHAAPELARVMADLTARAARMQGEW